MSYVKNPVPNTTKINDGILDEEFPMKIKLFSITATV
jgi:hypothetical protein